MRFTLWQRGRLIGETDFGLGRLPGGRRAGVFHPAPSGMTVLPALTAMAPALFGLDDAMKRLPLSDEEIERDTDAAIEAFSQSPEGQRVLAAAEEIADLELRDASGTPVAFESILVTDLHQLAAIGVVHRVVGEANGQDGRDPVRYVISVTLSKPRGSRASALHAH
ncbi:MAG: hypothetical protein ABR499_21810 [Gemmatimonadaceae bacterium]